MFNLLLVQPFINLLILFYSIIPGHDFGLAVIALTIFVRLLIWPLQTQTLRSQKALQAIQPDIKKIQTKYKNDPQKMNQLMMELYKEKEVNPFSSCLPSLLQLPVMIALFYAFIKFKDATYIQSGLYNDLYQWVENLGFVKVALREGFSTSFLGIIDLAKPNTVLAVLAGAVQFLQTKMIVPAKSNDATQNSMSFMLYAFPVLTIMIGLNFAAALPLYWIVTTAIAALQQYLVMHHEVEVMEEGK